MNVLVWPDGTWCWQQESQQHDGKSDDYTTIAVPEWGDELDIEHIAEIIKRDGKITDTLLNYIWGF
jgi:hypothetical protein